MHAAIKVISAGEFVCEHRFPREFEALNDSRTRDEAEGPLKNTGYRLNRLDSNGAYFITENQT